MSVIAIAIPTMKARFLGGLELSLLVFTDNELLFLRRVKRIGGGLGEFLSPLSTPLKLIAFGLREVKKFMKSIDSLKGTKIDVEEVVKHTKESYIIPYSNVKRIKISKDRKIDIHIETIEGKKYKYTVALGLYKDIKRPRDEVYRDIINSLQPIPKLRGKIET